jgi:hypothetical protein
MAGQRPASSGINHRPVDHAVQVGHESDCHGAAQQEQRGGEEEEEPRCCHCHSGCGGGGRGSSCAEGAGAGMAIAQGEGRHRDVAPPATPSLQCGNSGGGGGVGVSSEMMDKDQTMHKTDEGWCSTRGSQCCASTTPPKRHNLPLGLGGGGGRIPTSMER